MIHLFHRATKARRATPSASRAGGTEEEFAEIHEAVMNTLPTSTMSRPVALDPTLIVALYVFGDRRLQESTRLVPPVENERVALTTEEEKH